MPASDCQLCSKAVSRAVGGTLVSKLVPAPNLSSEVKGCTVVFYFPLSFACLFHCSFSIIGGHVL